MTPDTSHLPIAYPYVPRQHFVNRYSNADAIVQGTLFPELDLPFHEYQIERPLPKTPMTELMMLDFVCLELRLYLNTHPQDHNAMSLYNEYQAKAAEAKQGLKSDEFNNWVYAPWPWEGEQ